MHGDAIFYLRDSFLLIMIDEFEVLDPGFGLKPYGYLIPASSGSKSFVNLSTRPTYSNNWY